MSEKTTGYTLLAVGIIIMIFATIQIVLVLTGKANPIAIFQSSVKNTQSSNLDISKLLSQLQQNSQNVSFNPNAPSIQLFDPKVLNQILNLTVYYLIMQFLLGFGFKLSSLGTQLLRPIHIDMKNKTFESSNSSNKNS